MKNFMDHLLSPQEPLSATEPSGENEIDQLRAALRQAKERAAFQVKEIKKLSAAVEQVRSELVFKTEQARRRGEELAFANRQLLAQYSHTDTQADELLQANRGLAAALDELALQNHDKEKRAAELQIANIELDYQNSEKDQRAFELAAANQELEFQNSEKEKRASELVAANLELEFQNSEKEKRAAELLQAIAGLESFAFVSSHDLQEPLRKILLWLDQLSDARDHFSDKDKVRFDRVVRAAQRMRQLIEGLYIYSRVSTVGQELALVNMNALLADVTSSLAPFIAEKSARIEAGSLCPAFGIRAQIRLLLHHLIDNALKFSKPGEQPVIRISAVESAGPAGMELSPGAPFCKLTVEDNGIGFEPAGNERIFDVFQRLHGQDEFPGTGIGLALVRKIALGHNGLVQFHSTPGAGSVFTVYIPLPPGEPDYT
ncbi:MAG: two-component sensor histidine kinase [Chitinophagaceae bacterium]|nr:MAG: two-component sensor histidine kinase [Chitinophagaceae bacterium]